MGSSLVDIIRHLAVPTPLQAVLLPGAAHGHVWLKRDDLIHPDLAGNKWRKLQGWLEAALAAGARGLATAGGPHSQHLVATAFAGRCLGLPTLGFVRGAHRQESPELAHCRALGMVLQAVDQNAFRQTFQTAEYRPGLPQGWAYIPAGGAGPEAFSGIAAFWQEVEDQRKALGLPPFGALAASAGTGTFVAGLLRATEGQETRVLAFPAFRPEEGFGEDIAAMAGLSGSRRLSVHYRPEQGRFGQVPPAIQAFAEAFRKQTGIDPEPVYEAKMLYGLSCLLAEGAAGQNGPVLAVLAGGKKKMEH